ncbi:hypothetical protein NUW58_g6900 [Xylaria curta]|uniref:Uncharacterized protein n=1 Tax=Xylaria curta TaxID=42375 RepID=A0ACC1NMQ3_9PEZI|nr:hypothetical protein NUW58_g6900 [Xylaria curta]
MLQKNLTTYAVTLLPWLVLGRAQDLRAILTHPGNEWAPTTTISFPNSEQFVNATLRWDIYAPPTYAAAISPGTEADVVKAVQLATSHNISFLATSGRHGYTTTLAALHGGLAVDLSKLDSVIVNARTGNVVVGGGALSVRLVTADAKLIEVSATSNADLFWAIRGAGANFGVVTSATYQLHKITDSNRQVTNVDMIFPANMSLDYFNTIVSSYNGSLPALLAAETLIAYDATSNAPQLLANWVYYGPESEARAVLAPILGLNPPTVVVTVVPWNQLLNTVFFGSDLSNCVGNRTASLYGVGMRTMAASTYQSAVEKMAQFYANDASGRGSILTLEMFPNEATIAIPDSSTAYPWREVVASLLIIMADPDETAESLALELRSDFAATSGFPTLTVYVNYAHGDESLEQIYGSTKLPRLAALKKKWDPRNVYYLEAKQRRVAHISHAIMALHSHSALAVVVLLFIFYFCYLVLGAVGQRPGDFPPGPPTLPIIGNFHQMPAKPELTGQRFEAWAREYGPIYSLILGTQTWVVLNKDKAVRDLLEKRGAIYSSRPDAYLAQEIFSGGMRAFLIKDGKTFKTNRRIAHVHLGERASQVYVPYQDLENKAMLVGLLERPELFIDHFKRYTTSLATQTVFGFRTVTEDDPMSRGLFESFDRFSEISFSLVS